MKYIIAVLMSSLAFAQYPNSANNGHTGGSEVEAKQTIFFATSSGGTAQAQTAAFATAPTSLVSGMPLCWLPTAANTAAAPTFSPSSLTAHAVVKPGGVALLPNDIVTTAYACVIYNSAATRWELQNPQGSGTIARGTATLGTSAIAANTCATTVSASATGTLSTDVILWTPNADISGVTGYGKLSTDGLIIYPYPSADNVSFVVCNATGTSITPGAASLNFRVIR